MLLWMNRMTKQELMESNDMAVCSLKESTGIILT